MIGPATGTATRLAGSDPTGTEPNAATSSGDTAAWADSVTARGIASHLGPGRASHTRPAPRTMPAAPATDRRNPRDVTSSGSTSTTPVTPRARVRRVEAGRPSAVPTAATPAIAVARSTDGSARVSSAKPASTAIVARKAGAEPQPRQHRGGDHQREGDVLPRYGEKVGEAGGPEGVGHVRRLGPVVAEGDAGEKAAVALR